MAITITGGPSDLQCHFGNDNGNTFNTDAACVTHLLEVRQNANLGIAVSVSKSKGAIERLFGIFLGF